MPPLRIVIVRHGERQDQANPGFARSTQRPHDPPLSIEGAAQAKELGHFLATQPQLCTPSRTQVGETTVMMSSPLLRCVQTAAHIAEEMAPTAPMTIYVEPNLIEVAASIASDCRRNPCLGGAIPQPLCLPLPVVSERLASNGQLKPALRPSLTGCTETACLTRDENGMVTNDDHEKRAGLLLADMMRSATVDGKTVVIVTHAHIALALRNQLVHTATGADVLPHPTAFTWFERMPETKPSGETPQWTAVHGTFVTPHLDSD